MKIGSLPQFLGCKIRHIWVATSQISTPKNSHQLPTTSTNCSPSDAPSMDGLQRPVQRWSCVMGDPPVTGPPGFQPLMVPEIRRSLASYRLVRKKTSNQLMRATASLVDMVYGRIAISWYGTVDMVCRYLRRVENTSNCGWLAVEFLNHQ